jgi:hypothetical protein
VGLSRSGASTEGERWLLVLACAGLACRGFVYLLLAGLTLQVAAGHRGSQPNDRGAFQAIARQPFGRVLLLAVVAGFAALAIWEASGALRHSRPALRRLGQAAKTVLYAGLAFSALEVVTSTSTASESRQVGDATARLMAAPGGRLLVAAAGLGLAVGAVVDLARLITGGVQRAYAAEIDLRGAPEGGRRVVDAAALAGVSARCLVFALGGWFLVEAAVTYDPGHAKGLDGVLTSLAQAPFGVWLLALVGLGLAAFGGFSLLEARYARP